MKKIYAFLIVLLPILAVYSSPVSGVDLGTFCVLLFFVMHIILKKSLIIRKDPYLIIMCVYILFETSAALLMGVGRLSATSSIILRTFRFVFMMLAVVGVGYCEYFDLRLLIKILRIVTLIVAIYAIIQLICFSITGVKLINVFGSTKQGIVYESGLGKYEDVYRPPSIFLEPSGVTYYVAPYLCIVLFYKGDKLDSKKIIRILEAIIVTLGVICTTSGMGLALVFSIWLLWLVFDASKNNLQRIIFIAIFGTICLLYLKNVDIIDYTISRIFNDTEGVSAIDARIGGYEAFANLTLAEKIFGSGYGNYSEEIYYTSVADIASCMGIIGSIIVYSFYIKRFIAGAKFQKMLVLASIILMICGGIFSATYICLYYPILLFSEKIK